MFTSNVLDYRPLQQGHPESGKLWEKHINNIMFSDELNFKTTTHDQTIYKTIYKGKLVFLLSQVDDFAIACKEEATAIDIYTPSLVEVFDWKKNQSIHSPISVFEQSSEYIQISCANYIDRVLTTHNWTTADNMKASSKHVGPLPADAIQKIYQESGPAEGTTEHQVLEDTCGFGYRNLLGEMIYAYVTCHPDIGYAITTMSKFSTTTLTLLHYQYLKHVAKYLRATKHCGIRFKGSML